MDAKKSPKKAKIIISAIILLSIITLSISVIKIKFWYSDYQKTSELLEKIRNKTNIVEIEDTDTTETIEPEKVDEANPYWDYIKLNLINVDLAGLKEVNSDTVGWLQVVGTNINYPVVQTTNNTYYLNHSYNRTYNNAGWVFLDYRNKLSNNDKNTIIYAHGRVDKTMFGSLKNILTSSWLNNPNNYVVKLSTEYENTLWQVFSIYRIPTTNDYITINFNTTTSYKKFLNKLINRSAHNFNTSVNENDQILTLSTCYDNNQKVVLHAKLIKRSPK